MIQEEIHICSCLKRDMKENPDIREKSIWNEISSYDSRTFFSPPVIIRSTGLSFRQSSKFKSLIPIPLLILQKVISCHSTRLHVHVSCCQHTTKCHWFLPLICLFLFFNILLMKKSVSNMMCRAFEKISIYCEAFTNMVPLTFVLGFYVSIVVSRWWQQFMQIPWPDKYASSSLNNLFMMERRIRGGKDVCC